MSDDEYDYVSQYQQQLKDDSDVFYGGVDDNDNDAVAEQPQRDPDEEQEQQQGTSFNDRERVGGGNDGLTGNMGRLQARSKTAKDRLKQHVKEYLPEIGEADTITDVIDYIDRMDNVGLYSPQALSLAILFLNKKGVLTKQSVASFFKGRTIIPPSSTMGELALKVTTIRYIRHLMKK
jgi:hypothetical protein